MPLVLAALLSTLIVGLAQNGGSYTVDRGTTILVTLPSNASTGYRWRLGAPLDRHLVQLVSRRYVKPVSRKPGAAGKEQWRFRTVGTGIGRLRLAYVRPGHPKRVARRFGIAIRVR